MSETTAAYRLRLTDDELARIASGGAATARAEQRPADPLLAQLGPSAMSALWSLLGADRT